MKRQELEDSIYSLIDILNTPGTAEEDFQKLFEDHPHCLSALGYHPDFIAHPRLVHQGTGEVYIPDFICRRRSDGIGEIVDLKTPSMNLGTVDKRGRYPKVNAVFEGHLSQIKEYGKFFRDHSNREWYRQNFEIEMPENPAARLVGGGFDIDKMLVEELLAERKSEPHLSTYVDVLNGLIDLHAMSFGEAGALHAWSYYLPLSLHESNRDKDGRLYLLDGGHRLNRNRFALWIDGDLQPGLTVYDNDRTKKELLAHESLIPGTFQILSVEFASSTDFHSISLKIDSRTVQWSRGGEGLEFDKRLFNRRLHLGADLKLRNGAAFDGKSVIGYDRILSLEEQVTVYNSLWESLGSDPAVYGGTSFSHKSVLRKEKDGWFAPGDEYRPTWAGAGKPRKMSDFFVAPQ